MTKNLVKMRAKLENKTDPMMQTAMKKLTLRFFLKLTAWTSYSLGLYSFLLPAPKNFPSNSFQLLMLELFFIYFLFSIRPPPGLLPVLGPLTRYMTPTLDAALLICGLL